MSIAVIAEFPVHPERSEEFLTLLGSILADTRGFDGCEVLETFVDQADPGRVVLWERWPSRDHHRRYLAWRNSTDLGERLAPFLRERPHFTYLDARPEI
ncbi:MAG: antibiotic biosynthesis monooxygenase [Acidimicrobiia bacterium]|nr:antibiotic biosynthesis monooxygenase [Acidimicrobiia bacterium]